MKMYKRKEKPHKTAQKNPAPYGTSKQKSVKKTPQQRKGRKAAEDREVPQPGEKSKDLHQSSRKAK